MKKIISVIISVVLVSTITTPVFAVSDITPSQPPKSDYTIENSYFEDTASSTVEIARRLYIVNGDGDGRFRPYSLITHAEFAQMCCNAYSPEPQCMDRCADPWYQPAYDWLYYQTIAAAAPTLEPTPMAQLFDVYLDGRTTEQLQLDKTIASYDHIVTMLYILRMIHNDFELKGDVVKNAKDWAATTGIGYGPRSTNWRYTQSLDYVTREDALRLLLGLTGLGYSTDLAFGPDIQAK